MGKVISIANQKGGVGKTATTVNLATSLSQLGKKVLLIDLDPQSNATMCFGIFNLDQLKFTIADLIKASIKNKPYDINDFILQSNGVSILPTDISLTGVEQTMRDETGGEYILADILESLTSVYDYIIIDCMPSFSILTANALVASDEVIIPVQAHYLAVKGLESLFPVINKVKIRLNKKLKINGILITMYDKRTNFAKEIVSQVKEIYSPTVKVYNTLIPISIKVSEASYAGQSVIKYDPTNAVSIAYMEFAKELIKNG